MSQDGVVGGPTPLELIHQPPVPSWVLADVLSGECLGHLVAEAGSWSG
jgi:hypothetical protein